MLDCGTLLSIGLVLIEIVTVIQLNDAHRILLYFPTGVCYIITLKRRKKKKITKCVEPKPGEQYGVRFSLPSIGKT